MCSVQALKSMLSLGCLASISSISKMWKDHNMLSMVAMRNPEIQEFIRERAKNKPNFFKTLDEFVSAYLHAKTHSGTQALVLEHLFYA